MPAIPQQADSLSRDPQAGDQFQQIERGAADPVRAQLAGRVVGQRLVAVRRREGEIGSQLPAIVQLAQELADVPGIRGQQLRVVRVQAEEFRGLLLQRQGAAGGGADDRVTAPHPRQQRPHIRVVLSSRRVELAVGEHRQAATGLPRQDHFIAVVFQDLDRRFAMRGS